MHISLLCGFGAVCRCIWQHSTSKSQSFSYQWCNPPRWPCIPIRSYAVSDGVQNGFSENYKKKSDTCMPVCNSGVQWCAVVHSTVVHSTAQHSTAQHSTAQHSTAQHSTAQHSTAQHSTAQHSQVGHMHHIACTALSVDYMM